VSRRRALQLTETNTALSHEIDERDRVESALSKRLHQLEVLGAICTEVTRELDLKLLLDLILQRTTELIPAAESGAIFLWSEAEECLLPRAWFNRGDWIQDVKLSLGEGLAGVVAQRREGLRVNDYQTSPYAHPTFRDYVGTAAFLVEALVYQNQLVGVISLYTTTRGKTFTEEDAYLLKIFAAQAVIAIENARHHSEQMQQLTLLMQSNAAVQSEMIERQQAEEQLHETYQFLQSTLDAMPAHVAILDETGIILAVNAAWHRFADSNGYADPSHGVGTNYLTICSSVPEEDEASAIAEEIGVGIRDVMSGQRSVFSGEYACHCSMEQRWFLIHATRFESQERRRVVVVHENITEVKLAQIELQRQQEVLYQNEKLAAMSGLLASVAHELNNPLSVITMQADLLQEEAADSEFASLGADINQAAERCVHIVRNFLALARQTSPERAQVHLNEVIRQALQLLTPLLQVDEIDVHPYLANDLPPLWADAHQLHQVVVNLVTNAQQALQGIPPPRRITLTTQVEPATQQILLEIEDNGPGIPPEVKERIFEPFFTTKELGAGTGLGLPLCQGIMASHDGELSVESQPGHGAVFRLVFPISEIAESIDESTPPELAPAATNRKLLIVDDEAGTTKALARLFIRDGYAVEIASNGREAFGMLRAQPYDVILCDLRMPELDGPGLYRELERDGSQFLPRFIFLTGDTLRPEAREFLDATKAPYLTKPFRAAEVRRIVRQVLQSLS
ncbi:MAG: ATP-binding protein, partial [Candidatus Tectomicrobia bacterium]|nr:ATP-binding protein [Candidatus Tectomicrobia bacterium]